ncbi:hypothetical protein [Maridesulfovibrio ferrireducens]|uniref:hypothetical protein n=1 Tax=Maridesulfovibrio ferrireducens TaxID=246191 RepID=UPI001A183621|nr:hypothetical protein [Maridesulfovibrio ferrireducens]MBI9110137.1 hypothetical protein [Maridesulfovibrio ferrireducens]
MFKESNKYKLYLYFSIAFLATLLLGVVLSFDFITSLFKTSIPINSIITTVIVGSIYLVFHYIVSVCYEISIFEKFTKWCENPSESSFDAEDYKSGLLTTVLKPMISSVQKNGYILVNSSSDTRSIVEGLEQSISSRTSLVSFLGGFLVLLGLMGTFLGLTITLQSMGEILSALAGGLSDTGDSSILTVMVQLIIQLKEPMAGMGTAFSTSLFGLAGSGVVGILSIFLSRIHDQLKSKLENWLNQKTNFACKTDSEDSLDFPSDEGLSSQLKAISKQLVQHNKALIETLTNTNRFLLEMTILQQSSAEVMKTVQDQSIETTKEVKLGNELSGRLIKESRQMVIALEQALETKKTDS